MWPAIRLAGYQGEQSILTASLRELADGLDATALGRVVQFEPDVTQLGEKATSLFASVEMGGRHVAYMASSYLSARVPELAVLDVPFSVRDRDAALAALDGQAGALLREAVARRTGLHVLAFWDNGPRHISNAVRALRSPRDCVGLVIRTLDNAHYQALLAALQFKPITTDVKDLRTAVASGVVDAQENPLANLMVFELWRHHRHVSLTAHLHGVLLLVCPHSWYVELGAANRALVEHAVRVATLGQHRRAKDEERKALDALPALGASVLEADQLDIAAFEEAAAPLARRIAQNLPDALLRAYLPADVVERLMAPARP